jgi:dipeptidyl aminopeptidase/acylaminoacyl peptidase
MSTAHNDYNLSISEDGRTIVFARSGPDFAGARIMVAIRQDGDRSAPRPIEFSDPRYRDSDPWLTPDGQTLYFVSDRPTEARPDKHDLDIWRSKRRNGRWQPPEHLGDMVNGKGEELGPELHGGTLFFATARKSGVGGLDIYAAKGNGAGFGKPQLLPAPINSAASESDFTVSRDGSTALFWRQVGARGLLHLSRRRSDGAWSEPEPLPDNINIGPFNFTPAISSDSRSVTFASTMVRDSQAPGMADIYQALLPSYAPRQAAEASRPGKPTGARRVAKLSARP